MPTSQLPLDSKCTIDISSSAFQRDRSPPFAPPPPLRTLRNGSTGLAAKQEASKGIAAAIQEGRHLATFLRSGAKQRYGKDSEKMVEFGIPPFRGNKRRTPVEPPVPPGGEPGGPKPSA